MKYEEYSYSNRNLIFIQDLMEYINKTCKIIYNSVGLSIGTEDNVHEDFLSTQDLIILNDKTIYNAEKDIIPYQNNRFDFVFIKSVIEHISNTDLFLSEIYRVLKPGGRLIILTPDYQRQKDFFYDDYTHIKPFTLISLKMALVLNNFKINRAEWFWYYKTIWEGKIMPNLLPIRFAYWLTEKTGIKYFRWGADRQLFVIGIK